jgi:hypothetical protein
MGRDGAAPSLREPSKAGCPKTVGSDAEELFQQSASPGRRVALAWLGILATGCRAWGQRPAL